jgi:hypothetical protein
MKVTKESAQRLFCSFAMQLSKMDSCWYSLLFLFDNCPSVASLFGISQSDLLQLLELAGWVQTYSDRDPVLKMNAFKEVIHQPVPRWQASRLSLQFLVVLLLTSFSPSSSIKNPSLTCKARVFGSSTGYMIPEGETPFVGSLASKPRKRQDYLNRNYLTKLMT